MLSCQHRFIQHGKLTERIYKQRNPVQITQYKHTEKEPSFSLAKIVRAASLCQHWAFCSRDIFTARNFQVTDNLGLG